MVGESWLFSSSDTFIINNKKGKILRKAMHIDPSAWERQHDETQQILTSSSSSSLSQLEGEYSCLNQSLAIILATVILVTGFGSSILLIMVLAPGDNHLGTGGSPLNI